MTSVDASHDELCTCASCYERDYPHVERMYPNGWYVRPELHTARLDHRRTDHGEWVGGARYASTYPAEDEYYHTGIYEWTRVCYPHFQWRLSATATRAGRRRRAPYRASLRVGYRQTLLAVETQLFRKTHASIKQMLADASAYIARHGDYYVRTLQRKLFDHTLTTHVYRASALGEHREWVPFCTSFTAGATGDRDEYRDEYPPGTYCLVTADGRELRHISHGARGASWGPFDETPGLTRWPFYAPGTTRDEVAAISHARRQGGWYD